MYIKNPARRAVAAAVLATSAALAVGAVGAARADSRVTPDAGARAAGNDVTVVDRYEVVDGDSFWAIAERQLPEGATAKEVMTLTNALMAHNSPQLGYDDPAMLHPGDVVDVVATPPQPAPAATALRAQAEATVAPAAHQVVAGDSYWAIAESVLGAEATPGDVADKTEALIELNSARLGYADPQMLHPGDVVYLEAAVPPTASMPTTKPSAPTQRTKPQTPSKEAARAQIPTSPPLSEIALIASETISPMVPASSGSTPAGKPSSTSAALPGVASTAASAPRSPAASVHASAI